MNNEYIEFVKSRAKGGDAILLSLTPEKCHLLHMVWGIVGESLELITGNGTVKNQREELGDIEFYLHGIQMVTEFNFIDLDDNRTFYQTDFLQDAEHLLDQTKKKLIYNKPVDLVPAFVQYTLGLKAYYRQLGFNRADVINENMSKLLERYANGYSDKAAQERADKEEDKRIDDNIRFGG